MNKTIAIVHYNTPALTYALVRSIRKHTPDCRIVVFDNSDNHPFPPTKGVEVIANNRGEQINFNDMICRYPQRIPTACNWGSEKHIASVDRLFDILPDGFLLMDSDILLKKDITPFFNKRVAWMGSIEYNPPYPFMHVRLFPMLLWINVPMLRKHNIRFWHEGYVYKLSHQGKAPYYDTAGSLLMDCEGLPHKEVDINEYMIHYGGASCTDTTMTAWDWLEQHKDLYE